MDTNFLAASLKMVIILIVVTGVIFLLLYSLRRFRLKSLSLGRIPEIRLINMLNLSYRRSIALVEVSGQWLLVGLGPQNVSLLMKMNRPSEIEMQDGAAEGDEEDRA